MSQIGRTVKNLEAPRPLKTSARQSHSAHNAANYEVQNIDELISLTENVATSLSNGFNNQESMSILLSNLRIHGPQLEALSKDTLDRAFVTFRNASQDERLNIMTRLNLLELIELRAKSWQISDGINTYYKHKATNVEPDIMSTINDLSLLSTSPPATMLGQTTTITGPILGPGELLRASGKFIKPTKIPGKNYSKDEVVIRNADSGKVMGIKGRRVHMIEELSETIISFQRVNPGAKERLVQITGPNEDKINYAKQLIEDTIRRNASPVRLEASQGGSCSSLASSASDETQQQQQQQHQQHHQQQNTRSSRNSIVMGSNSTITSGGGGSSGGGNIKLLSRNGGIQGSGGQLLLHSFSTNDASLGEYKYTVNVGQHNIKITGDCFDLVRVAKLVLDDYFSSSEFLASVDAGASFDTSSTGSLLGSSQSQLNPLAAPIIPPSHQLMSPSPFVDSGIGLNMLAQSGGNLSGNGLSNSCDVDDDVFIVESPHTSTESSSSSSSSNNTVLMTSTPTVTPTNGLTRSRRSHFSRKDSTPEAVKEKESIKEQPSVRIVHEYERLIYYAKSPHSWALPRDWIKICEKHPTLVRNKVLEDEKNRFEADKHLEFLKSGAYTKFVCNNYEKSDSPDPE